MSRDTFEVYYNQNNRWQLHASYEASQRELAIEEAKVVEQKEGYATRVVRETFQPETNTTENVITWQSSKAKAGKMKNCEKNWNYYLAKNLIWPVFSLSDRVLTIPAIGY